MIVMENNITIYNPQEQSVITGPLAIEPVNNMEFNPTVIKKSNFDFDFGQYTFQKNYIIIDNIFFENHFYALKKGLKCNISLEEDLIVIFNKELNIRVWGLTKKETLEAFNFQFHSLYENFALEYNNKLSDKAQDIKRKLIELVAFTF